MTKQRIPAQGVRKDCKVGLVVRLDDETFDTIRERAVKDGTGVAEQIRLLIEWTWRAQTNAGLQPCPGQPARPAQRPHMSLACNPVPNQLSLLQPRQGRWLCQPRMPPMLRCLALFLACLLLFPTASHAAKLGFTCTVTYKDTGTTDRRTVNIDTVARSVRDQAMITIDGAANAIARNQVEFVDIGDDRIAWGSRLRATDADVLVIAIDLHTGRYTFTSHLRGLRTDGTCEATSGAT